MKEDEVFPGVSKYDLYKLNKMYPRRLEDPKEIRWYLFWKCRKVSTIPYTLTPQRFRRYMIRLKRSGP